MTILGIIVMVAGLAGLAMELTGNMPGVIANVGIPIWAWGAGVVVGGLLIFFNRRPGD